MRNKCKSQIIYIDYLGQHHNSSESAERENHEISLQFRQYIQEELISTFSDGKVDNLQTTLNIWQMLDFTDGCIMKVSEIMSKKH